ncbi:sel1 repeat family protein [Halomonas sp. DP8Y7-3]|uniref:tetratricopeptide repeat protein n=1 Tax=Halomonas sp. DP8Y7-3 TaxID=2859079 RepID=UPI001C938F78|nr:tetratricopeptide repeat protein [Halomonas sp. DP8Y7-3]MBY5929718.1 sel1 repeat family protein [Halomonas sp. DP8Y7-3]
MFLVLFFLASCGEREVVHDVFHEMSGRPIIINLDTDKYSLLSFYDKTSYDEILRESSAGDLKASFLKAILLLADMPGYGVEPDLNEGVSSLKDLWGSGIVDAGYYLYLIYNQGSGVQRNTDVAINYLSASANYGYPKSQQVLGMAYSGKLPDRLVNVDFDKAVAWFSAAAEQGDKVSAIHLSGLYYRGQGVVKNYRRAFELISGVESMPYGSADDGFYGLAFYYENGIGTDVDLVQAYKYYDLLSPGSAPDKARLAEQMTPEQIREAISLSRQWQEEHNIFVPSYYGLEYQEDGTFQ